jgi:hypothetical protein
VGGACTLDGELRHRVQALGGPVRGGVDAAQGVAGWGGRAQAVEQLQPRPRRGRGQGGWGGGDHTLAAGGRHLRLAAK